MNDGDHGRRRQVGRRDLLRAAAVGAGITAGPAVLGASPPRERQPGPGRPDGAQRARSPPPGPAVLHDDLATSPLLTNAPGSRWSADPLLVCGAMGHVDGEFLYQDYLNDDHGATTAPLSPPDPPNTMENTTGDLRYPTDADRYRYNAADLLEFRATPTGDGVAYRVRLNTMVDPDSVAVALGVDTGGAGRQVWGHGLGSLGPLALDHVVTVWGSGGTLDGDSLPVAVDADRNQFTFELPRRPRGATWRHYLVVGLFDADAERFVPVRERPTATHPGGANGRDVPPVFNVGFRVDEPLVPEGPSTFTDYREAAQARALADRDISRFGADIDFGRLRRRETTYEGPGAGFHERVYASRLDLPEGVDADRSLFGGSVGTYGVYVPTSYDGSPTPLHVDLHSKTNTANDFGAHMPARVRQFGEDRDALVLTPRARGPGGFYLGVHEVALFEAWNDLRHRYAVDAGRVTVGGHSMGSYGTYRLAGLYPDLFAAAFTTTGATGSASTDRSAVLGTDTDDASRLTENLRHVPLLQWHGAADELAPVVAPLRYEQRLREHGYRHELDVFTADHFTWPQLDEWERASVFLEDHATVTRTPARVTYRRVPAFDNQAGDLGRDGVYWLSDVAVVDGATDGRVDAESAAIGDPEPRAIDGRGAGTDPLLYVSRSTRWERPVDDPVPENRLVLDLERVASLTVWVDEAGLDATDPIDLQVETTHPATVTLQSARGGRSVSFAAGEHDRTVRVAD